MANMLIGAFLSAIIGLEFPGPGTVLPWSDLEFPDHRSSREHAHIQLERRQHPSALGHGSHSKQSGRQARCSR